MRFLRLDLTTLQTGWAYSTLGKWCLVKMEHRFYFCPSVGCNPAAGLAVT
jgi:hypothetical protein